MKNLLLAIMSVMCISYATNAVAQNLGTETVDDGTILLDDSSLEEETSIEVKNGALFINDIKVADLDEATQLKIVKRNPQHTTNKAGDSDGVIRFRVFNKAMLGVGVEDTRPSIKITSVVAGSAADKAGFLNGDIITAIDDQNVIDFNDLTKIMAQHKVGDEIKIAYYRNKELKKLTAKLTENTQMDRLESNTDIYPIPYQGLEELFDIPINELMMKAYETNLTPQLGIDLEEDESGLKVINMEPMGNAAKAGIMKDDIIKMVNGRDVMSLETFEEEIKKNPKEAQIAIGVLRNGNTMNLQVEFLQSKRRGSF